MESIHKGLDPKTPNTQNEASILAHLQQGELFAQVADDANKGQMQSHKALIVGDLKTLDPVAE
ncbi:MAG: hypothetical protein ACM3SR_00610 [Ignavibacteriales bacterium]